MTREEAYRLAMRACEGTWNEKTCKQIREALEQEPCDDAISREAVIEILGDYGCTNREGLLFKDIRALPSVIPQEQTGHCKDCKYFEYNSVAKNYKVPIIVAHEICSKWGDGCKTKEDGYCFLFEPQESEE